MQRTSAIARPSLRTSFFHCLRLRGRKQPRKRATSSIYMRQGWVRTTPIIAIWSQPYLPTSIAFRLITSARNKTVRWSPSMIHDEPAVLTSEEFDSLVEVGEGETQRDIPQAHWERLVALGYALRRLGVLGLTESGKRRLATGNAQAS